MISEQSNDFEHFGCVLYYFLPFYNSRNRSVIYMKRILENLVSCNIHGSEHL